MIRTTVQEVWETGLHNPDFSKYAEICGALGIRVTKADQLDDALARALSFSPKLLIFDEPVSALDEPTRCDICTLLKTIQQDFAITTIQICHNLEEARIVSDRVAIMSEGRIIQTGPLASLYKQPESPAVRHILRIPSSSQQETNPTGN